MDEEGGEEDEEEENDSEFERRLEGKTEVYTEYEKRKREKMKAIKSTGMSQIKQRDCCGDMLVSFIE